MGSWLRKKKELFGALRVVTNRRGAANLMMVIVSLILAIIAAIIFAIIGHFTGLPWTFHFGLGTAVFLTIVGLITGLVSRR